MSIHLSFPRMGAGWLTSQMNREAYEIYVRAFRGRWRQTADLHEGRRVASLVSGRPPAVLQDEVLMSVVVRTEGNELQVEVPQAVVETDDLFSGIWDWDVAPDGKRFVLIRDEESSGPAGPALLKFTFHWFEELKRLVPRK